MPTPDPSASGSDRWFETVKRAVFDVISEEFGSEPESATHMAWASGGLFLAQFGVERLQTIQQAWKDGSLNSAHRLTTLFTLHMISRWYRAYRADRPIKDETRAVQIAASNILTLFGQEALGEIIDFENLHVQFAYECDWQEGKTPVKGRRIETSGGMVEIAPSGPPFWGDVLQNPLGYDLSQEQYAYVRDLFKLQTQGLVGIGLTPSPERPGLTTWHYQLVMDKALVACGGTPFIDWRLQTFPVEKHGDLRWASDDLFPKTGADDFVAWLILVANAQEVMFECYRDITAQRP